MNTFSKISLFALLTMITTVLGQEPPKLKHPATSAAAQALNESLIEITYKNNSEEIIPVAKIRKKYLCISSTFKNLFEETGAGNQLEIPASMAEELREAQDLFEYEFKLQNEPTNEDHHKNNLGIFLAAKDEHKLVTLINACQTFALNKVSPLIVEMLAKKLNTPERKQACQKTGSYHLNYTRDVACLVAQAMIKDTNFIPAIKHLMTYGKNGKIEDYFADRNDNCKLKKVANQHDNINSIDLLRQPFSKLSHKTYPYLNKQILFEQLNNKNFTQSSKLPGGYYSAIKDKKTALRIDTAKIPFMYIAFHINHWEPTYGPDIYRVDTDSYLWVCDKEIFNLDLASYLTPERVVFLEWFFNNQRHSEELYEKLPLLRQIFPKNIQKYLLNHSFFPYLFWQDGSFYKKAAIVAGGVAATGLSAWLGYKYYEGPGQLAIGGASLGAAALAINKFTTFQPRMYSDSENKKILALLASSAITIPTGAVFFYKGVKNLLFTKK